MTMQDVLREEIERCGELHGTEEIALTIKAPKWWLIKIARRLMTSGEIEIIPSNGGRGHKTTYRRNRNSPGQPRKIG